MPVNMTVKVDISGFKRMMSDLQKKQIPFATSKALNATAFEVMREANLDVRATFQNPRPFSQRAFAVIKSTKASQTASVILKADHDYIAPYIIGGQHIIAGNQGLRVPVNLRLDQYGQMTRPAFKRLVTLANTPGSDVFFGTVHGITGWWKRPKRGVQRAGGYGTKGALNSNAGFKTGLKLLLRFEDNLPVKEHLPFFETAEHVTRVTFPYFFRKSFEEALRSAK